MSIIASLPLFRRIFLFFISLINALAWFSNDHDSLFLNLIDFLLSFDFFKTNSEHAFILC